jgi:hypothetical protein
MGNQATISALSVGDQAPGMAEGVFSSNAPYTFDHVMCKDLYNTLGLWYPTKGVKQGSCISIAHDAVVLHA